MPQDISTHHRKISSRFSLDNNPLSDLLRSREPLAINQKISVTWDRAVDFSVFDADGNQWIDFTSGIFVANAGHSNPKIKQAIQKQLDDDLLFSYTYPTRIRQQFIERLLSLSPSHFDKVILLSTGSEAVDDAYRLIRLWGRPRGRDIIVSLTGSYHGRGLSNDMICGRKTKAAWSGIEDPGVVFLDFPYDPTARFDPPLLPKGDRIAAFFLETFQGWGAWFYPPDFIAQLYNYAKKCGALVCFDEMQSGFYRLGTLYGYQSYDCAMEPDILCLGKAITSSLPLSAVLGRKEIIDVDASADLHGTQSGNPLCCAAGLANLEFLSDPHFLSGIRERSALFASRLNELCKYKIVKCINVRGLIAGIILDNEPLATAIVRGCVAKGVLPVCTNRNSIKLAPPLTISADALSEGLDVIEETVAEKCR